MRREQRDGRARGVRDGGASDVRGGGAKVIGALGLARDFKQVRPDEGQVSGFGFLNEGFSIIHSTVKQVYVA